MTKAEEVEEALKRLEYRNKRVYERYSGQGFVAHDVYLDGEEVWYQREYGIPPRGFKTDPRVMAKTLWLANNPISIEIWTSTNLPLSKLKAAARKHNGFDQPHFYGPEGYGFLGFHDEESAMAFVLSEDYQRWKGEYDETGDTPLARRISNMLGGRWVRSWKDWLGIWFFSKDESCTYALAEPSRGGLRLLRDGEEVGSLSSGELATFDELNPEKAAKPPERTT